MKLALLLLAIVFVSGCTQTGQVANKGLPNALQVPEGFIPQETGQPGNSSPPPVNSSPPPLPPNLSNITAQAADPCSNRTCGLTNRQCPDGFVAECREACLGGECYPCIPSCEGHSAPQDPCEGISCQPSFLVCPDGFNSSCTNSCSSGSCPSCIPDCSSHQTCTENWTCSEWPSCLEGIQTRTCTDQNGCGTSDLRPPLNQTCTMGAGRLLFSEVYYDTIGEESEEEWVEILNPNSFTIDLSGWSISDNSGTWSFPGYNLSPGYLVIARDATAFSQNFSGCIPLDGFTRGLNNNGDSLNLTDPAGILIDFVAWDGGADGAYPEWSIQAGEGKSISRNSSIDTDSPSDWLSDQEPGPCH